MGQDEIYQLLKNKRLGGSNEYYSAREISTATGCKLNNVHDDLTRLRIYGFLELRIRGNKYKRIICSEYRLKKEYI
jgi:Fic family protein